MVSGCHDITAALLALRKILLDTGRKLICRRYGRAMPAMGGGQLRAHMHLCASYSMLGCRLCQCIRQMRFTLPLHCSSACRCSTEEYRDSFAVAQENVGGCLKLDTHSSTPQTHRLMWKLVLAFRPWHLSAATSWASAASSSEAYPPRYACLPLSLTHTCASHLHLRRRVCHLSKAAIRSDDTNDLCMNTCTHWSTHVRLHAYAALLSAGRRCQTRQSAASPTTPAILHCIYVKHGCKLTLLSAFTCHSDGDV